MRKLDHNTPKPPKYFIDMVNKNKWHDASELPRYLEAIKKFSSPRTYDGKEFSNTWSWSRNWNCKYIELRFDMRDGGFVLLNDLKERICIEQLEYQWNSDEGL